jgi:AraC-like DNA-binding protein
LSTIDGALCAPLHAGGDWAVAFRGQLHVKFGVVLSGSCLLSVDEAAQPVRLATGDCFLVIGGRDYRLASDLGVPFQRPEEVWSPGEAIGYCGTGDDVRVTGGRLYFDPANADLLISTLPPVVHMPAGSDAAGALNATIQLMSYETAESRPGQSLMLEHLARIVLMHGVRARTETPADPAIGNALTLIHDDVKRPRSIDELAKAARMSRSAFAEKFKAAVGESPGRYMLSLRMHSAKQLLENSSRTVSSVAIELGYGSEAAFSTAFKRVMGASPRNYR